jgi:hypothetical protein
MGAALVSGNCIYSPFTFNSSEVDILGNQNDRRHDATVVYHGAALACNNARRAWPYDMAGEMGI